jgi:hypothetical protein
MVTKQLAKTLVLLTQEGKIVTYLILVVGVRVALVTLLSARATSHGAKPSPAKELNPLKFLDAFLFLRRSPSSSLLLELEEESAELDSTSLAPTIARAFLPRPSFFLDCRSSLCL